MMVCIYNPCRLCNGCMVCLEEQPDPEDERDRRIDAAYDKEENRCMKSHC